MKEKLQSLARRNGQLAKVKAGRLVVILRVYQTDLRGGQWMLGEAAHLAKSVAYHLRQADLIGRFIAKTERKDRQAKSIDIE